MDSELAKWVNALASSLMTWVWSQNPYGWRREPASEYCTMTSTCAHTNKLINVRNVNISKMINVKIFKYLKEQQLENNPHTYKLKQKVKKKNV